MALSFQNFISDGNDAVGETVKQFLILEAFSKAATAEADDHVHIVR